MVGVPGRSKGCHNCRQRKIKCDGERPGCKNCSKSNRTCTGYQKNHAFILSRDMVANSATVSHDQGVLPADDSNMVMVSRWRKSKANARPALPTKSGASQSASRDITTLSRQSMNASTQYTAPPNELPVRTIFRDSLIALSNDGPHTEVSIRLPYGNRGNCMSSPTASCKVANELTTSTGINQVLDLPEMTPALEDTLLAVATAQLGQREARPDLIHESLVLYTKGLAALRSNILNPATRNKDENLAACMASLVYEVRSSPGNSYAGYKAHYYGTLELLRLRGADSHTSGLAHSVFKILRVQAIMNSVLEGERSFLLDPEWLEKPWSQQEKKPHFERLVDILLHLSELSALSYAQESSEDPLTILSTALETVKMGFKMDGWLDAWFEDYKATVPGALYHPELSTMSSSVDDPEKGRMFPVAFQFPALMIAINVVYYWVSQISVQAHICFTYAELSHLTAKLDATGRDTFDCECNGSEQQPAPCLRHFTMDQLPPLGHRTQWPRTTAYNVAQSAEYFILRSDMRGEIIPALVIMQAFWTYATGDFSREVAWVQERIWHLRNSGTTTAFSAGMRESIKEDLLAFVGVPVTVIEGVLIGEKRERKKKIG